MKIKLAVFIVLFAALGGSASGQGFRFDQTVTQQGTIGTATNAVVIPASPQVKFCNFPANAVPCSNLATTYTSVTLGTPCSTSTQIVLTGTTSCIASPDAQDNWGVWVPSGTYSYTITLPGGVNLGPYSVTLGIPTNSFAIANAGVFTNTQMNEYLTSLLNGFSPAASMHVDPLYTSFFNTEALTGGVTIPVGAAVINGIGVAGYADSLCNSVGRTKCNASGGFFRSLARGNNSAAWGVNPQVADIPGLTGHSLTGNEVDVGVYGSPAFVRGLDIILAAGQNSYGVMPADSIGIEIFTGAAGGLQWNKAISIDRGAALSGQGLVLDGKLLTNPTSSISAAFLGYDGGGVAHQSSINGDSAGNLILQPALGSAYSINNSAGGIGMAKGAFSALTACSGANEGTIAAVTDSTTNTWGATITGSGANHVLAYCDGTNWTVAGK